MKTVTVVGVGALGSHLVQFLRSAPAAIKVVDFDRVEQRNTASQFHAKAAVGKGKVKSLGECMQFLWGKKILTVPYRLAADNDAQILGDAHLVVDCLDNGPSRRIVQGFVRRAGVPCVHGALAADGSFGQVVWDERFVVDDEPTVGAPTCEDGAHLPFIAVTSAYLARAVQAFLADGKKIGFQVRPNGAVSI